MSDILGFRELMYWIDLVYRLNTISAFQGETMREISKDNLLRSWKDISAYLGCDVRTCHRWEASHGMPVHRAEGGEKKSPVFAYKDELDAWFRGTFRNSHEAGAKAGAKAGARRPYLIWALGAAAVLVLAGAYLPPPGDRGQAPAGRFHDRRVESRRPRQEEARALALGHRASRTSSPRASTGRASRSSTGRTANFLPGLVIRDIDADGDTRGPLRAEAASPTRPGRAGSLLRPAGAPRRWRFQAPAGSSSAAAGSIRAGLPHRRVHRPRPRRRRPARDRGRGIPRARLALPAGRSRLAGNAHRESTGTPAT